MVGKYLQKIIKCANKSKKKKLRCSWKREKMKEVMIGDRTVTLARCENNNCDIFTKTLGREVLTKQQKIHRVGNKRIKMLLQMQIQISK